MPLSTDTDVARVLSRTRRIAVVGASAKPQRPSHQVMQYLQAEGFELYPVNPGLAGQTLLGCPVYARLADIPVAIDMVDVFRRASYLPQVVEEAIEVGAGLVWTQLDVVDHRAAAAAERAGLEVVMDRCPAIEMPRLKAAGLITPA